MRFEGLDLNLLVALDALITEQNVSLAAERVHLSQSAMSGALSRLREYFGDDLLVSVGRKMVLTPRAESLMEPVRSALLHIKSSITNKSEFDPAVSTRRFSVMVSDYTLVVLFADVMRQVSVLAPHVQFELSAPYDDPSERVEQGDVDLLIMIEQYTSPDHPIERLFEDTYVVIAWTGNTLIKDKLDMDMFLKLGHVSAKFGRMHQPTFEESFVRSTQYSRRVEVVVPSFTMAAHLIVGTNRISTMHKSLAERFAQFLPIRIYPHPMDIPRVCQTAQWNKFNNTDAGLRWLVNLAKKHAAAMKI